MPRDILPLVDNDVLTLIGTEVIKIRDRKTLEYWTEQWWRKYTGDSSRQRQKEDTIIRIFMRNIFSWRTSCPWEENIRRLEKEIITNPNVLI